MKRFEDKTVLIIGGNSGIGLASAKGFYKEGAKTIITGRNQKTINAALAEMPEVPQISGQNGPDQDKIAAQGFSVDVSDLKSIDAMIESLKQSGDHLDTVFVNAGIGTFSSFEEITPDLWDMVHNINLRGCVFAAQKSIPLMKEGGNIIFTGSIGAHAALPGNSIYAAAKAGLSAVMKNLAKEMVGRGIRVNMVSPGPTETPILTRNVGMDDAAVDGLRQAMINAVPMHRMGEPEEVANAVLFLASDAASFITGIEMFVDGGTLELR